MVPAPSPALGDRFRADCAALTGAAPGRIALAVSGGPDSVALLLLARATLPGVCAATVDHGLRAEAADEARAVAALCADIGVDHATLRVTVADGGAGRQGEARAARYRALGEWARAAGAGWLLTAHHRDDQAETVLMRLARGAGLAGLAGIRPARPLAAGVMLGRPLLGWSRAELGEVVRAAGVVPVDDPSNRDPRYDRTAARTLLAETAMLDPARLARSAAALAEAEDAIDWTAREAARSRLRETDEAIEIDAGGLPRALQRRLLLIALGRAGAAPDGPQTDRMLAALAAGEPATISEIKAIPGACWRLVAAPPRRAE